MEVRFGRLQRDMQGGQRLEVRRQPRPLVPPPPWMIPRIEQGRRRRRGEFPEEQPALEVPQPPPGWKAPMRGPENDEGRRGVVIIEL